MKSNQENRTIWNVWANELPARFPKNQVIEELAVRWGISRTNVYSRIRKGNLKNFVADVSFFYTHYAIGFTHDKGYFFDSRRYDQIEVEKEKDEAVKYGLAL